MRAHPYVGVFVIFNHKYRKMCQQHTALKHGNHCHTLVPITKSDKHTQTHNYNRYNINMSSMDLLVIYL